MDVVLALGFDLFFKPRLAEAAKAAGVEVRHAPPEKAVEAAQAAARVVADVSAPGVQQAVEAVARDRPGLPILVCYPHVEEHRAQAARAAGAVAVTRGRFAADLPAALAGRLA